MKKQTMTLAGIPAILYGSRSRNVYLYLHGKNGCKEEAERFAATACEAGWQVLAIDLPEHGARKNSPERLLPWVAVPEIEAVYARMKPVWAHIRLYGVSIGAWFAMQALQGDAPEQTLLVPRYLIFKKLNWLDSYKTFIIPALFATYPFFIYMMIQFIRGIPRELDESAKIDGCNAFQIFGKIILPLSKPAMFSVIIFQFVWRWNDFFNPLIYINDIKKYPLSLALRSALDISDTVHWNRLMAMSLVAMLPPVLLYIAAQKYFVEGIATTGLKG